MQSDNQQSNDILNNSEYLAEDKIDESDLRRARSNFNKNASNTRRINNNRFQKNGFHRGYFKAESNESRMSSNCNDFRFHNNEYTMNNSESINNESNFQTNSTNRFQNFQDDGYAKKYYNRGAFSYRRNNRGGSNYDYFKSNSFGINNRNQMKQPNEFVYNNSEHNIKRNNYNGIKNDVIENKNISNDNRSYKNVYRGNNQRDGFYKSNVTKNGAHKITKFPIVDISKMEQRELLIHELNLSHYECMICMNSIQKDSAVWSCEKCYHIFHLNCIKKWAQSAGKKDNVSEENQSWRCPACQNANDNLTISKIFYKCFCGKQTNPVYKHGTTPHSCGDACAQSNQINLKCPHLCCLQCHPGPCPPCEASVTRQCHCGKTRITAKCNAEETQFQCQSICDKIMQCGLHQCERQCHVDDGHQCQINVEQKCWCGSSNREVLCGSDEAKTKQYDCGATCSRVKNCGNHKCESLCHEGDCDECEMMPDKVKYCCCGKKSLIELSSYRKSCLDPVVSCGSICGKSYGDCEHTCPSICHEGKCAPCTGSSARKCRCKSSTQTIQCASTEVVQCRQRCKEKLLCGRHRCDKQCCDLEVHLCQVDCGRLLSCKTHRCDRECGHPGLCPSCHNVSFEELFCECQATFTLPPIACGTAPPLCNRLCTREHQCDHSVRHNCHNEPNCPPCTELVNKPCPGGHTEYSNVPCFRPVATCGQPCGRPLEHCSHVCTRPCHGGPCVASSTEDEEPCRQSCTALRKDCLHPCSASCHPNIDCTAVATKCMKEVVLSCECTVRPAAAVLCDRLKTVKVLLRSQGQSGTGAGADIVLSAKDGQTYLACNNDCKRAARNVKLAEAFNTPVPLGLLFTFYPDSIKDFGQRNKNYVVSVQNVLVRLQNGFLSSTRNSQTESIAAGSADQAQFVQRYSECFKMRWQSVTDTKGRTSVVVEAVRGVSRAPRPLLTEVLREKYPHLFQHDDQDKDTSKDATERLAAATNSVRSLTFADRLKMNTK